MKRKVRKFNEGGKTYEKEDEGLFGGKVNYREEDGRKYVAGKATPFDRNPPEQRYYSVDDVKSKLSGLFGGKKEEAPQAEYKSRGDRFADTNVEERPRQMTDRMTNKPEPAGKTYLREEADIDKEEPKKKATAPAPRKAAPVAKAAPAPKKVEKEEATPVKKERPKSVVFKTDVFEEEKEQAAPVVRKVVKETAAKEAKKAADTTIPKAFDMKSGNKTVYGTKTTDVFRENEERKRKAAADKEAKKAKSDEENREFRSRSLSPALRKGGTVKKMASGGMARSSASSRGDGCAVRGKTKGRIY